MGNCARRGSGAIHLIVGLAISLNIQASLLAGEHSAGGRCWGSPAPATPASGAATLPPAPVDPVQSGFRIGQECDTCLRGVIATKDLEPGYVLQRIPFKLGVIFQCGGRPDLGGILLPRPAPAADACLPARP
jgi:hypothetical protein